MAISPSGLPLRNDIAAIAQRRGLIPSSGQASVLVTPWSYWHRRDVSPTGVTNYTFFNETKGLGITNLDNQGVLPANQVFEVQGMTFHFLPGFDRLGRRLGVQSPSAAQLQASILNGATTIATSADPLAPAAYWNEKARELLEQGTVRLLANGRTLLEQYGLTQFPAGRGVLSEGFKAFAGTFTAGSGLAELRSGVFNGVPYNSNVERFASKVAIFPGQAFSVTVDYNQLIDFTQSGAGPLNGITANAAGVLTCELFGVLITNVA